MSTFKEPFEVLRTKYVFVLRGLLVCVVVILFLAVALVKVSRNIKASIELPGVPFVITAGDPNHVKLWGRHIISIISEFTPHTYEQKLNSILAYASSRAEKSIREKARDDIKLIKENNRYQSFHIYEGTWSSQQLTQYMWKIKVRGQVETKQGSVSRLAEATYWCDLIFRDRIFLEDFGYEYDKQQ